MPESVSNAAGRATLLRILQRQGITDAKVLAALERVPRERFVTPDSHSAAYDNRALEIGHGQTISQPYIVALMTQELRLTGTERVLEVGTGSGYQAAILACLAETVYTIERIPDLSYTAEVRLDKLGVENVHFRLGDGSRGWPEEAPFDRIVVTATGPSVPQSLQTQLADEGTLVMPVGSGKSQSLLAFRKNSGRLEGFHLCDCRFVPLIGAQAWSESEGR